MVKLPEEHTKTPLHTMITGTASAIRVIVDSRDRQTQESFSTVGVGTNIIEASWRALVDAVEYKLSRDDARWATQTHEQMPPLEAEQRPREFSFDFEQPPVREQPRA